MVSLQIEKVINLNHSSTTFKNLQAILWQATALVHN